MTYFIYLSDVFGLLNPALYFAMASEVKKLFEPVIRKNGRYANIEALWIPALIQYPLDSLAVHITPSDCSIGNEALGRRPADPRAGVDSDGYTAIHGDPTKNDGKGFVVSEVFGTTQDVTILSKLIFHECMHNKLLQGDEMHALGGLASGVVDTNTQLTSANIDDMAAVLHQPRVQMKDAISLILARRLRKERGDPAFNL